MTLIPALLAASSTHLIFRFFRRLGIFGLLLLGMLDSSFLVLPFGNDLLLIAHISSKSRELSWIVYVLASALGSVIGVLLLDLVMRKTGEKGLSRFVKEEKLEVLRKKISDKTGLTLFLATILPPPFPFTPVIMAASALQVPRKKILFTVFVGRLTRFTIEGVLALYFGRRIIAYLNSDYVVYAIYALIAFAVIASVISLLKWKRPVALEQS